MVSPSNVESQDRTDRPLSPCQLICTLDEEQRCIGCGRTLMQISRWALMTTAEQWTVIDDLARQEKPE
jgi:predicted Fe-S protein YdhL (DUF1289 family)